MALTKEELEEQRENTRNVLVASYEMYDRTIAEAIKRWETATDKNGNKIYSKKDADKTARLVNTMKNDVIERYIALGYTEDDLKRDVAAKSKESALNRKKVEEYMRNEFNKEEEEENIPVATTKAEESILKENKNIDKQITVKREVSDNAIERYLNGEEEEEKQQELKKEEVTENAIEEQNLTVNDNLVSSFGDFKQDPNKKELFGFVKLPSNGECYKHKLKQLRVSYLTAYDENMILSANLYTDGRFMEYMAKTKILDNINVDELIPSDLEAVIIWLRATAYGNDYPIVVTDPETGKEFDSSVDLTKLKYNKFSLHGDENGYFDFVMPNSQDKIKFKFLSNKDSEFLMKLKAKESKRVKVAMLRKYTDELLDAIKDNDILDYDTQEKVEKAVNIVHDEMVAKYNPENDLSFTHELTDRLNLHTISINGITDRKYISDYIANMNVKDASEYRKYISNNAPGIDYNIKVKRPKSLGGGSIDTFLQLDQFIFVNI